MSDKPDEKVVYSARGQNGAQYDVVKWEGVEGRLCFEVRRSGGTSPGGKAMPPQKCGTYYSLTAAKNRADDSVRLSAGIYREIGKQRERKAKRDAKAPAIVHGNAPHAAEGEPEDIDPDEREITENV